MNSVPITIIDNFIDNAQALREYGLSIDKTPSPGGVYPGIRSLELREFDPKLKEFIERKITSLFAPFPSKHSVTSNIHFHEQHKIVGPGWIHQDECNVSFILYLSPSDPKIDLGTDLFDINPKVISIPNDLTSLRYKHYIDNNLTTEEWKIKSDYEKKYFNPKLNIQDKFNRLLIFPSNTFHRSNGIIDYIPKERLTLVGFIHNISCPCPLPGDRSRGVNYF